MPRHRGSVLVDTNVILEAHRTGSWRALAGAYHLETVEDCVTETQTGFQHRRPERMIDEADLRKRLAAVHDVEDRKRAELAIRIDGIALDRGEAALWAHARARNDDWILCGPDAASLRFGVRLGHRDRLVAMETLLDDFRHRPHIVLRWAYTRQWHESTLLRMVVAENNSNS